MYRIDIGTSRNKMSTYTTAKNVVLFLIVSLVIITLIYSNNFSSFDNITNIPYQTALAIPNLQTNNNNISTSDSNETSRPFTPTDNDSSLANAGTDKAANQNTAVTPNIPSFVKVVVRVNNTSGGSAQPSDFSVYILGDNNPRPGLFDGSEEGTIVSMTGKGEYSVDIFPKESSNVNYGVSFSGDCVLDSSGHGSASIDEGERQTCIGTMVFPSFN